MMRIVKSGLALAALSVVPMLTAFAVLPQDPVDTGPAESAAAATDHSSFRRRMNWNFALLQYRDQAGVIKEIPASNLVQLWVLATARDTIRLELLFQNKDYTSIEVDEFHLIRSAPSATAVDLPIVRDRFAAMAFPTFD